MFDQTRKLTFRNYPLVLDCIMAIKEFKAQHETFSIYYLKLCLVCNTLVTINFFWLVVSSFDMCGSSNSVQLFCSMAVRLNECDELFENCDRCIWYVFGLIFFQLVYYMFLWKAGLLKEMKRLTVAFLGCCTQEFYLRIVRRWNRMPSKAVDAPSLGVFKASLDGALATWSGERCPSPWQWIGICWSLGYP